MFMIPISRFLCKFFTYKYKNQKLAELFENWKYGWIAYQFGVGTNAW